ncbi:fumarylacetoacetate hydrolase family protein [Pacificimonas sp. WHA3]|uniref:Fumarylacetoacetate hydrolase family protein n=1 Tax=Pacificimonas pallii TaxID=2827236 RepID=A0ABS6SG19_9SPHN|nr:fumarylacetoacetate hydrolase family protein [Pacificimonas pallii]MBV7257367.1 fumarylacetoacetate hydrolase family protein [Pacificimonas pallii]
MKFVTFRDFDGKPRPGVVVDGDRSVLDLLAASGGQITTILQVVEGGPAMLDKVRALAANPGAEHIVALDGLRLEAPLRPVQLRSFSVYALHLERSFRAVAKHHWSKLKSLLFKVAVKIPPKQFFERPVYYKGTVTNIAGPHDDIIRPPYGEKLDYELELAVIIGKKGKSIAPADAEEHVFGYLVYNDVSAREQLFDEVGPMSAGPAKGKDFDNSNIIGPWLVTRDEVPDPMNLKARVRVNGEVRGESSTSMMSHSIAEIIAYTSTGETLYPGEMIATGAMPYCCGIEDWKFLDDADEVRLEIDGIGQMTNRVVPG